MKTAVFDIDETILVAKEWGDAVGANGEIPGALEFVKNLESEGYTIAYCTARPSEFTREVMAALADYGFPHTSDLVFLLPKDGDNVPRYKKNTIKMLMDKGYDVERFYDDVKVNRSVVSNLGVPIVEDLRETLQTRKNPKETLGYINDKSYEPLVRNMARVRRKSVTVDPSVPLIDFGKLESVGREAKFRWEICGGSVEGVVSGDIGNAPSSVPSKMIFESGYIVHDPAQPDERKLKPRYFSAKATKTDKYGVNEKVYWPFSVNTSYVYTTTYNYDKFPGWLSMLSSILPGTKNPSRSYYDYGTRYNDLTYTKKPGAIVAIYESPYQKKTCTVSYVGNGVNWTVGFDKKIGKNQLLKEIDLIFSIGLITPWIHKKLRELAENRGRRKTSSLGFYFPKAKWDTMWTYSGALMPGAPGGTKDFIRLDARVEANGVSNEPGVPIEEHFEGVSQTANAIASGSGSGLTRRQLYAGDAEEIKNIILQYLAADPEDFEEGEAVNKAFVASADSSQYDAKMKRLIGEAPSLISSMQPLIDARKTIRQEWKDADAEHLNLAEQERSASQKDYEESEKAARIIYDAEKKRVSDINKTKRSLASLKRKRLSYADEMQIRADAAKAIQAEIDTFKEEQEQARLKANEATYQHYLKRAKENYEIDDDGTLLISGGTVDEYFERYADGDEWEARFLAELQEFIDNQGE